MRLKRVLVAIVGSFCLVIVLLCGLAVAHTWRSTPAAAPNPAAGTATAIPFTARDIELQHEALTQLQWNGYRAEVVGREISFAGQVMEVYSDGRVQVDFASTKGLFTRGILYRVPREQAIGLQQGQAVRGTGRVRSVDTLLGLSIEIEVVALE